VVETAASERTPPTGGGASAPASAHVQRGVSPLQAYALRPVTEGNCVAMRRGGEQPEVRDQSAGGQTRFGLTQPASLLANGEA